MGRRFQIVLFLLWTGTLAAHGRPRGSAMATVTLVPPPAPPPIVQKAPDFIGANRPAPRAAHSIGQPTDEEQLILEFINRARADANAEAQRLKSTTDADVLWAYSYFKVDLDDLTNQFATLPQHLPPLSMNEKMLAAARLHSQDMFSNRFQGHLSSTNPPPPNQPNDTVGDRLTRQGYVWWICGENVYAYGQSPWHAHAGFEVDWGMGTNPPGHRMNLHNTNICEIGVGVVAGVTSNLGPRFVTEDLGASPSSSPFITGVAYFDLNGNDFYDLGEGIGGIAVEVEGQSATAVTSSSGGYSIPVGGNGAYSVFFSAAAMETSTVVAVVASNQNVKVDCRPAYQAPVLTGPTNPIVGMPNPYGVSRVAAATGFDLFHARISAAPWLEGAENGTGGVEIASSAGYDVIQSAVVASGTRSFHLAQPDGNRQVVTVLRWILPSAGSQLRFRSRLGEASTSQVARVALSTDEGASWSNLHTQAGSGGTGESIFTLRSFSLAAHADHSVRIRFEYDCMGGAYYPQTSSGVGWYVDDIEVTDSRELVEAGITSAGPEGLCGFTPDATNAYRLMARARNLTRVYPFGPPMDVAAATGEVEPLKVFQMEVSADEPRQLTVRCGALDSVSNLFLQRRGNLATGEFTAVPGLSVESLGGGLHQFRLDLSAEAVEFYRVRGDD